MLKSSLAKKDERRRKRKEKEKGERKRREEVKERKASFGTGEALFEPDLCQLSRKPCMTYVLRVHNLFLCEVLNLPDYSVFLQFLSLFYSALQILDVRQIQCFKTV